MKMFQLFRDAHESLSSGSVLQLWVSLVAQGPVPGGSTIGGGFLP